MPRHFKLMGQQLNYTADSIIVFDRGCTCHRQCPGDKCPDEIDFAIARATWALGRGRWKEREREPTGSNVRSGICGWFRRCCQAAGHPKPHTGVPFSVTRALRPHLRHLHASSRDIALQQPDVDDGTAGDCSSSPARSSTGLGPDKLIDFVPLAR